MSRKGSRKPKAIQRPKARTKGIREFTDPARPPRCNVYCEPYWDGERWQRRLNRRGRLKLEFWFSDHGDEGKRIIGFLRTMHPAAYHLIRSSRPDAWDDVVSEMWAEALRCLTRWEPSRAKFQTVLGWGMKAVGCRLIESHFHPKNQFHLSLTFASELDDPARTGESLMETAATDRYERDQAEGTQADRDALWGEVRRVLANNPRSFKVLYLRFARGLTLSEISGVVGVTKERVRQIEMESLKLVREQSSLGQLMGGGQCRSSVT